MKTNKTRILGLMAVVAIGISASSCNKDGCTDPNANNYDETAKKDDGSCTYDPPASTTAALSLNIQHFVGTDAFSFDSTYQDGAGNDYKFTLARVYLSNPSFEDMSGNPLQSINAYALVEPGETSYSFGNVNPNHLHEMTLQVGIDSATNHMDPAQYDASSPLAYQVPTNHWAWSSGYRFISLEGDVDTNNDGTMDTTFIMHIGTDALYRTHNPLMIMLDAEAGNTETVNLKIDWAQFINGLDLSTDNLTHTMNNMPLATTVANNSVSAVSNN